jgi:hypothetical protein
MKNPPPPDIAVASTEQLLDGLATADLRTANPIDTWVESTGVYPGTTKVRANKLYEEYLAFMATRADLGPPKAIRVWGKHMASKFRHGRSEAGKFYYISRERDVCIPTSLKTGGAGTGGRGDPVP